MGKDELEEGSDSGGKNESEGESIEKEKNSSEEHETGSESKSRSRSRSRSGSRKGNRKKKIKSKSKSKKISGSSWKTKKKKDKKKKKIPKSKESKSESEFKGEEEEEKEQKVFQKDEVGIDSEPEDDEINESDYESVTSVTESEASQSVVSNQTILNVPPEVLNVPIDVAAGDKELVDKLEITMIQWIRQLTIVLRNQAFEDINDNTGPLDEIKFWKEKIEDLNGLAGQIKSKNIKIVKEVLRVSKSPYLEHFEKLSREILNNQAEAISNLHYLSILIDPSEKFKNSKVAEMPEQFQNILWLIRIIWLNSPFYNEKEKLNRLLRKFSNEILSKCKEEIDLGQVFLGDIDESEVVVKSCLHCCTNWKVKFMEAQKMHSMNSHLTWLLEYEQIFSHIDAFCLRLKDLLEILICQRLFSNRGWVQPLYPGTKGPELTRVMADIQRLFEKELKTLYENCSSFIFDLNSEIWGDNMAKFKTAVKDMEMMLCNSLTANFELIPNIEQGLHLLEIFYIFYQRTLIIRTFDKLTVQLYKMLEEELHLVQNLYSKNILPLPLVYPQLAGRGAWVLYLKRRLDQQCDLILASWWLPESGYGREVIGQCRELSDNLKKFSRQCYQNWIENLGSSDLYYRLEIPLMRKSTYRPGTIEVNFDNILYQHITEAEIWARLGMDIPPAILSVYQQKVRLHKLRETVLLVVKDYNKIIASLSLEERSLFKERIKLLGRKIYPGLTKLTWVSDISDSYINEARHAATKVQGFANDYKSANLKIGKMALKITNYLLIKVEHKKVYEGESFNRMQEKHREKNILKIANCYRGITLILQQVNEMFKSDGPEVKVQWVKYLKTIDEVVEEAICINLTRSLEILLKAIQGDLRGPPHPIFRLDVILNDKNLGFSPDLDILYDMVCGIYGRIADLFRPFPRIIQFLTNDSNDVNSYSQALLEDKECNRLHTEIRINTLNCITKLENYLSNWKTFSDVWDTEIESFMKVYELKNPPVEVFDEDIQKFWEIASAVQSQESVITVQFCIVESTRLKEMVTQKCDLWRESYLKLLYVIASAQLMSYYKYMQENLEKFPGEPDSLDDLLALVKNI